VILTGGSGAPIDFFRRRRRQLNAGVVSGDVEFVVLGLPVFFYNNLSSMDTIYGAGADGAAGAVFRDTVCNYYSTKTAHVQAEDKCTTKANLRIHVQTSDQLLF